MNREQTFFVAGALVIVALLIGAGFWMLARNENADGNKLQVMATFYPLAYFAEEIGGEKVHVDSLVPSNSEIHSWQPSVSDILAADRADVLLYNGAGLDIWFEDDVLPSLSKTGKTIVETTDGVSLMEPVHEEEEQTTRLFLFDNDKGNTFVYDLDSDGHAALHTTLTDVACDALPPFSGYFDTPPLLETSQGYWYIFSPRQDEVVVVNTGIHGDHFHDAEVLNRIDAAKPVHPAVSPDTKYVAFSEDSSKKSLVIEVSAPAKHHEYDNDGTQSDSHATVAFDEENRLYSGDMKSTQGSNLLVIDPATGSTLRSGDSGKSPHGAVYSPVTKKVYFNTADGIHTSGKNSDEGNFSYQHTGFRLVRSWMAEDGRSLVSYVRNLAMGIEYDSVVVYDVTTKELLREIDVNINAPDLAKYGYANSEFVASKGLVLLGDPETGRVHIVNISTGAKTALQLDGTFPQSLRVTVDNLQQDAWAATRDGNVSRICLEDLEVETVYHLENGPGVNFVIAAVTPETGEHHDHEHVDEQDHGLYDPHTWVSPFLAKQQAENIFKAFVEADPDNEHYYTERWEALRTRFENLDDDIMTRLADKKKTDIFVTHSAYGYLAERYGFHQHGVIGISADEQPSISTIETMVEEMEEHGVYTIFVDPIYSDDYARTLKGTLEKKSGQTVQILKLYLMLGPQDGIDYFDQQKENIKNLEIGLEA